MDGAPLRSALEAENERAGGALRTAGEVLTDVRDYLSLLRLDVVALLLFAFVGIFVMTGGFGCFFCCNGCGRWRSWQRLRTRLSRLPPFIDLLSNGVSSRGLTVSSFVFGFMLASGVVLSKTLLLHPVRLFPPRDSEPVARLKLLCAEPLVSTLLQVGGDVHAPPQRGTQGIMTALKMLAFDQVWARGSIRQDCEHWPVDVREVDATVSVVQEASVLVLPSLAVVVLGPGGRALPWVGPAPPWDGGVLRWAPEWTTAVVTWLPHVREELVNGGGCPRGGAHAGRRWA